MEDLKTHNLPPSNQWGFVKSKSRVTALIFVVDQRLQPLQSGAEMCSVFCDLKKAFDSVPHRALINMLVHSGVDSYIVSWISSYLTNRMQQVVLNGQASRKCTTSILSGVTQGSVLGPLLFLVYIRDLSDLPFTEGTELLLYAHNTFGRPIKNLEDYRILQQDLGLVTQWVNQKHLQLNPSKCKYMIISRRLSTSLPPSPIVLQEHEIQRVQEFAYLGFLLSSNLSLSKHINNKCNKARHTLWLMFTRFGSTNSCVTLRKLYISYMYVRPHLEYAAPLRDPHMWSDISHIESVQRFA